MATRMQQRRGTAAQWTAANPILAAGEIGFETDTSKFKMGNGSSAWAALTYFANAAELETAINALVGTAPGTLDTIQELAAALGDNPAFLGTLATSGDLTNHNADTTQVHGIADTAELVTNAILSDHNSATTNVHGIADTAELVTQTQLTTFGSETVDIHGIANTADLITSAQLAEAIGNATGAYPDLAGEGLEWDVVNEHLNVDTAIIATATSVSDHTSATTSVHGIADTSALALTATVATDIATALASAEDYADGLAANYDAAGTASDAVSAHNLDTTNVHGIADTAQLALLSDVAAVTAASIGLGNVDNTSDADKPVSTATVTAIATAKSEAIAEVTAVIDGAPNALNTLNELAAALGDDANFASTITTSLAAKVDSYTPITQKTESYTLSTLDHRDDLIEMGSASALTLTIPLNSSIAYPVGTSLDILQTGAGQVTIAGAAGVTVNATPGLKLRTQWSSATLFKRAENTWVVYGDLTA